LEEALTADVVGTAEAVLRRFAVDGPDSASSDDACT
jgi:hypothetical protein